MTARNDITGDSIQSRVPSQQYKDNWDKIFGEALEEVQEVRQESRTLYEELEKKGLTLDE